MCSLLYLAAPILSHAVLLFQLYDAWVNLRTTFKFQPKLILWIGVTLLIALSSVVFFVLGWLHITPLIYAPQFFLIVMSSLASMLRFIWKEWKQNEQSKLVHEQNEQRASLDQRNLVGSSSAGSLNVVLQDMA